MKNKYNILKWENPDPKEEEIAERSAEKVGSFFWDYNLPLQFYRDEDTKKLRWVLNYQPRRGRCEELLPKDMFEADQNFTEEDVKDVCDTTIAILKNLIRQIEAFRDGKTDIVYYPNSEL